MRLINATPIEKTDGWLDGTTLVIPKQLIYDAPTIDAVTVVRCKDCKRRKNCRIPWNIDDDFFCADGERKDGDSDG